MTARASHKDVFSPDAAIYDRSRRRLIPGFDDFYGAPARILAETELKPRRCLDLGANNGWFSLYMLSLGAHVFSAEPLTHFESASS